jgi:hypothetical protein
MSCHLHADTIADLAREVVIHTDVAAAARVHLAVCPACAVRFERQRTLTAELRALAAASADASPSSDVTRRLLEAFAAQQPLVQQDRCVPHTWRLQDAPSPHPQVVTFRERVLPRFAVAAMLVFAASLAWWSRGERDTRVPMDRDRGSATRDIASTRAPSSVHASVDSPPRHGRPRRPRRPRRPPPATPPAVEEFIAVPGSAALPEFESGRIVRVELPVAALPAYGVDIAATAQSEIAADVLVGQDGHARAIRLVHYRP